MPHSNRPPIAETATSPRRIQYVNRIENVSGLPPEQREALREVTQRYVFRANDYYLGLIDWNDPMNGNGGTELRLIQIIPGITNRPLY